MNFKCFLPGGQYSNRLVTTVLLESDKRGQDADVTSAHAEMTEFNFEQSILFWLQTVTDGKSI